ncbi:DMT family transporter [Halobacteria archaeon AArc-curdl1]|uniref:DMT family transporter n=1 Tax=Natronosalvus hydrolyticus TaxID=2979988 RepID=A0AAP2ZBS1_9EURY|nr:DMT family transporter [Halobacteria archaeon AArc-curdl1]
MSRYRNLGLFLVLAAVWGTAFVAISAGLEYFPPVLYAALRYDIAGIIMLAYAAYVLDDVVPRGREQWLLVTIGSVLLIAAYHAFLFIGQQHTTAAAAAIVVSLSPVLTTGFARLLVPSDALSPLGLVGVAIGLVGVAVIAQPDPNDLLATNAVAIALVFFAAASFALGSVLTRRLEAEMPIESMEAWSMLGGAVLMHLLSLALREPIEPRTWVQPEALGALAYLALVSSALGFLLYFVLLERLGAVEINMVSYVAPIFAAVFGWLYLGEVIDATTVFGFALIAVGFVLVKRRALREEFGHLQALAQR